MHFKDSQTFSNLAKAFAGESQARNRYTFYAGVAKSEGHQYIQQVFLSTADNEKEHAKVFYKLLLSHAKGETDLIHVDADYPLAYKDTLYNLKAAAEGEREEWEKVYSHFADVADQEGYKDIAAIFRSIADVEKHHMTRYKTLAEQFENETLYKKDKPTSWKCTNCGYVHEGPEAPDSCPACQHPKGYFEELPQTY
jgi:rubrerythrin